MKNLFITILTYSPEEFESITNIYLQCGYKIVLQDENFVELRKSGEKPVVIEWMHRKDAIV